jgi:hypothetical protein
MTDEEAAVIETACEAVHVLFAGENEHIPLGEGLAKLDALHVAVLRLELAREAAEAS